MKYNIKKLEAQLKIEREKAKKKRIASETNKDIEKRARELQREIDFLKGKNNGPGIKGVAKRTYKGLKYINKKASPIIKKQIKLIREQQKRENSKKRKSSIDQYDWMDIGF